jgi:hypothetical protein
MMNEDERRILGGIAAMALECRHGEARIDGKERRRLGRKMKNIFLFQLFMNSVFHAFDFLGAALQRTCIGIDQINSLSDEYISV